MPGLFLCRIAVWSLLSSLFYMPASFASAAAVPLHPAIRVLLWLAFALFLQHAEGTQLAVLVVASCVGAAVVGALPRWWRTVWRLRWLLLSLSLVFALATPGDPVFASDWAPTREGLLAAAAHGGRLLALLAAVVILAATTPVNALMSGLYWLLAPLRLLGLPPERAVVRLLLTLDYVEDLPERRGWREFMAAAEMATTLPAAAGHAATGSEAPVTLVQQPFTILDVLLPIAALALGVWLW